MFDFYGTSITESNTERRGLAMPDYKALWDVVQRFRDAIEQLLAPLPPAQPAPAPAAPEQRQRQPGMETWGLAVASADVEAAAQHADSYCPMCLYIWHEAHDGPGFTPDLEAEICERHMELLRREASDRNEAQRIIFRVHLHGKPHAAF